MTICIEPMFTLGSGDSFIDSDGWTAKTKDKSLASTSIRISLSHLTTEPEIDEFLKIFDKCYKEMI